MAKKKTKNKNKVNNKSNVKTDNIAKRNKTNKVNEPVKNKIKENKNTKNSVIMKTLVFLGVLILCGVIIYLMNYFFVEKSYIKINISTDKKLEFIDINGKDELVTTQKYISDLNYKMRYDVNNFNVFKYKEQDIFKLLTDEKVVIIVEQSSLPSNCSTSSLDMEYNNCVINVDDYTEEYYISQNNTTYKLTLKNTSSVSSDLKTIISYMLNSFEIKQ